MGTSWIPHCTFSYTAYYGVYEWFEWGVFLVRFAAPCSDTGIILFDHCWIVNHSSARVYPKINRILTGFFDRIIAGTYADHAGSLSI